MWEVLCESLTEDKDVHVQSETTQGLPDGNYYGVERRTELLEDKQC